MNVRIAAPRHRKFLVLLSDYGSEPRATEVIKGVLPPSVPARAVAAESAFASGGAFWGFCCLSKKLVVHIKVPQFEEVQRHVFVVLVSADPFFEFDGGRVLGGQEVQMTHDVFEGACAFWSNAGFVRVLGGHDLAPSICVGSEPAK